MILTLGITVQFGIAQNQPDIRLESVNLNLLPEFNQPSVFVVYEINLQEKLSLPQDLTLQVPADVRILNVFGFTPDHRPVQLNYQESQIGNWKDVRFSPPYPHIHIEYQDPNLVRQGHQRSYELEWLSIYSVASLTIRVRQPLGTSQIHSEPPLEGAEESTDGTGYFTANFGAIPAGELFSLTFSYTKDTADLAYPALSVRPAMPIDETTLGRTPSTMSVILWLLVAAVAGMTIVGLYYWWFRSNIADRRERVVQGVGIMNPEKQTIFCYECGMRARVEDAFCSNCGTELRKPTPFEQPPGS